MAFVDDTSCECVKSELEIFSVPPTQTSIECGTIIEFNPIASLSDGTPIEFSTSGTGQDYIDLGNSQLYVKAQIVRADNTPIDNTDHVGPVNLLLHSLFSEVEIKLNDTVISSTNNTYGYRSYLETLLTYGPDTKQSQLTSALYYKDAKDRFEDGNPLDGAANAGFKSRDAHFNDGRVVEMLGTIHSDLFFKTSFFLAMLMFAYVWCAIKIRSVSCPMLRTLATRLRLPNANY